MDDARKEVGIYPDRNVGMSALHGYGYFADDMYPLGKEKALDLHRRGLKVYCLHTDGSNFDWEDLNIRHISFTIPFSSSISCGVAAPTVLAILAS